ncbi:hypothetical protein QIG13_28210, partial [Klebsiella pneumoniae]|nr:hypothetical protein [Klebsiella pneumoniae]
VSCIHLNESQPKELIMHKYTVLLNDGTVGTLIVDSVDEGQNVTVDLHDENGNPITATGTVVEILEESES